MGAAPALAPLELGGAPSAPFEFEAAVVAPAAAPAASIFVTVPRKTTSSFCRLAHAPGDAFEQAHARAAAGPTKAKSPMSMNTRRVTPPIVHCGTPRNRDSQAKFSPTIALLSNRAHLPSRVVWNLTSRRFQTLVD